MRYLPCGSVCVCSVVSLCDPVNSNLPGFSVHGIFQARTLGCHFLFQGTFPIQESNPHLLYCHMDSLPLSHLTIYFLTLPRIIPPARTSSQNRSSLQVTTWHLCLHVQNLNFWSTPPPCLTHIFPCRVSRQLHPSSVWGQNLWSPPWFLSFPHAPPWCPSEFYWVYLRSDPCDHFCPFKSGAGHWGSLVFLNTCAHVQTLLRGSRLTALWKLKTSITLTLHSLGVLLFI